MPRRVAWLIAHVRAPQLDRQLAAGAVPWFSQIHAARAIQLASDHHRRGLARSLEQLIEQAENPPARFMSAVISPCRQQVCEAMPEILAISSRLRSGEPVDARGVARLRALLSDGSGPCYIPGRQAGLSDALHAVSRWLDVAD